jgi:hypothetical protein
VASFLTHPPLPVSGSRSFDNNLELHCFLYGDHPNQVFLVKIASTESVGNLQKAIKDKKKPVLDHITADALTLWKVSIAVNGGFKENVSKVELRDEDALSPVVRLSEVFQAQPEDGHLHIILRPDECEWRSFLM